MTENNKFQELNDDDLTEVNGGVIGNKPHILQCLDCREVTQTIAGEHLPAKCPKCGSQRIGFGY